MFVIMKNRSNESRDKTCLSKTFHAPAKIKEKGIKHNVPNPETTNKSAESEKLIDQTARKSELKL
jgi:hypothetical protein